MPGFQSEKALVREYHSAIAGADAETISDVITRFVAPEWQWRGMHPFHEQTGPAAVAATFWAPLMTAMTRLQRRPDMFMAGLNEIDGFNGAEAGTAPSWFSPFSHPEETQMGSLLAACAGNPGALQPGHTRSLSKLR